MGDPVLVVLLTKLQMKGRIVKRVVIIVSFVKRYLNPYNIAEYDIMIIIQHIRIL